MALAGNICITIPFEYAGRRLDVVLTQLIPDLSRSCISDLIRTKNVWVENSHTKPGYRLNGGERVEVALSSFHSDNLSVFKAQPIDLNIIFEDEEILVINKEPGMVVHPAPGNYEDTLVNALLYRYPQLNTIGTERPGIVHRLDKETSGVLVIAKNQQAHNHLSEQFQRRSLEKRYLALIWGIPGSCSGTVNLPVGRHPVDRKKMSVHSRKGRSALTYWKIKEVYNKISLLEVEIKTGRTHQIRVHCAAINHPIIGDALYGGKKRTQQLSAMSMSQTIVNQLGYIQRQMLHAWKLNIVHPVSRESLEFEAPLPRDMADLIQVLRQS